MSRVPTKKQYGCLKVIGGPCWIAVGSRHSEWASVLRRGWVERVSAGYRITPAGLRALADGLERYGRDPW